RPRPSASSLRAGCVWIISGTAALSSQSGLGTPEGAGPGVAEGSANGDLPGAAGSRRRRNARPAEHKHPGGRGGTEPDAPQERRAEADVTARDELDRGPCDALGAEPEPVGVERDQQR